MQATRRSVRALRSWHAWVAVAAWLLFSLWFFASGPYATMAEQGGIPDEDVFHTADETEARVAAMNATVQDDYRTFLWADMAFAALYGTAAFAIIAQACRVLVRREAWWALVWVPVAGACADVLENVAMLFVLGGSGAGAFVVFQSLKAVFTTAGLVLAAVGAMALLLHGIWNPVRRSR